MAEQEQQQKRKKKAKVEFKAREGSRLNDKQAEAYGKRIYELMNVKGKDSISSKEIIKDAENSNSPFHDYFDWDNEKAGDLWRLEQARHLINSIVIVNIHIEDTKPVNVRAFINVIDDEGEKGYVPIDVVMSNPKTSSQVVMAALREAKSWHDRYKEYIELAKIHQAIQENLSKFTLEDE